MSSDFFNDLERIILLSDVTQKCEATQQIAKQFSDYAFPYKPSNKPKIVEQPGLPAELTLVAPRELKKRGMQSQQGRNILMHAVAHIEFNAINLALDAAYRFRNQPHNYYRDWVNVAADEARHFGLVRDYLNSNDCSYGDYPVHNGLWEMAVKTADDVVARMALVPRVLEARGLDVTPGMIERLNNVGDRQAVAILNTIYQDEIGHVEIGSRWFFHQCEQRKLEPKNTFLKMIKIHLHGELKGPFNISARLQAGFDEMELTQLETFL